MEHKHTSISVDELTEIIVDGSEPIEPRPRVSPPIDPEKQDFLQAIDGAQRRYTGRSLSWGEIFEVIVALGYRKVEKPVDPPLPPSNGEEHGEANDGETANEKPT